MTKIPRLLATLAAVCVLALTAVSPAGAADGSDGIVSIEIENCTIVVTFESTLGGDFRLEVWDDGELLGTDDFSVAPDGTGQGRYLITDVVKQGASGLGIVVAQGETWVDKVDPYNGADGVLERCAAEYNPDSTPVTRPEVITTTVPAPTVTTTTAAQTTTTASPTTSTTVQPTTTAPAQTTTTSGAVGGSTGQASPARPIAAAARYTG